MDSEHNTRNLVPRSISTTNLENAGVEAAIADGILKGVKTNASLDRAKKAGVRRGKWTSEEEAYSNQLIHEFKAGLLPLTDGTTLRTFLSKLLNCDPMRISKKFVGGNCIGKQVFRRRQVDVDKLTTEQIEESRRNLADLERRFLERVAQTNRVKVPGVNLPDNETYSSSTQPSAPRAADHDNERTVPKTRAKREGNKSSSSPKTSEPYSYSLPPSLPVYYPAPQSLPRGNNHQYPQQQQQSIHPPQGASEMPVSYSSMEEFSSLLLNHGASLSSMDLLSHLESFSEQHSAPTSHALDLVASQTPGGSIFPWSASVAPPPVRPLISSQPSSDSLGMRAESLERLFASSQSLVNSIDHEPTTSATSNGRTERSAPEKRLVQLPTSNPQTGRARQPDSGLYDRQQQQQSEVKSEMPRNNSIDNFWMLVDMGDLPEPATGVLSENLFAPSHGSASADNVVIKSEVKTVAPAETRPRIDSTVSKAYAAHAPVVATILEHLPHKGKESSTVVHAGSVGSVHKGILSAVDASSHMYDSHGGVNTLGLQAVTVPAMETKVELKPTVTFAPTEPVRPSLVPNSSNAIALSSMQGGGNLLLNMNGKRAEKDLSIVTGIPSAKQIAQKQPAVSSSSASMASSRSSSVSSLPTSLTPKQLNGSISKTAYAAYHPLPHEDDVTMKAMGNEGIVASGDPSSALKRKYEDAHKSEG